MKISRETETQAAGAARPAGVTDIQQKRLEKRKSSAHSGPADEIALSDVAKRARLADKAVTDAVDVRVDVVHRMQMRIRNDAFKVDAEKVAQRLLESL